MSIKESICECGTPGTVGMPCSDPDCGRTVQDVEPATLTKLLADDLETGGSDRYDDDLLAEEGAERTVSLED